MPLQFGPSGKRPIATFSSLPVPLGSVATKGPRIRSGLRYSSIIGSLSVEAAGRPVAGVVPLRSEAVEEAQLGILEPAAQVHLALSGVGVELQPIHKVKVQQFCFSVAARPEKVAVMRPVAEVPHRRTVVQEQARLPRTSVR